MPPFRLIVEDVADALTGAVCTLKAKVIQCQDNCAEGGGVLRNKGLSVPVKENPGTALMASSVLL